MLMYDSKCRPAKSSTLCERIHILKIFFPYMFIWKITCLPYWKNKIVGRSATVELKKTNFYRSNANTTPALSIKPSG